MNLLRYQRGNKGKFGNQVEFCIIISAKTECAKKIANIVPKSAHNSTESNVHPLLSLEEVKKAAESAKANGATRFCVVTSGRHPSKEDFPKLLEMIKAVADIDGLHSCCSLGILDEEQVRQIKEAGAERYNHNINTAKSFHHNICTTHDYEDRINTIKLYKNTG